MAVKNVQMRLVFCLMLMACCPAVLRTEPFEDSCGPILQGRSPVTQDPPYVISAVRGTGSNGVIVTISSSSTSRFQKFFLQARDPQDENVTFPGSFSLTPNTRLRACPPGNSNTLSHANLDVKENLTTIWTPSSHFAGQVVFRAAIADHVGLGWQVLETVPVEIKPILSTNPGAYAVDYKNCGAKKSCFGFPKDCVEKENCDILLTFVPESDGVVFEITADVKRYKQPWIAVGLSDDDRMGNDSVTDCLMSSSGQLVVQLSWNYQQPRRGNRVLDKPTEGLSDTSATLKDNVLSCRWKRAMITEMEGYTFDLRSQSYFILLASGEMAGDQKAHHSSRLASEKNISLTVTPTTSPPHKDSYASCGLTKGCFGLPSNCVKSQNCQVLVKYSPDKNGVLFELSSSAISEGEDSWIAVALSSDNKMGNDSVTDCLRFSTGEIKVQQSWNSGTPRSNKVLGNKVQGLTEIQHDYTDGVLTCRWKRELSTVIEGVTFDLTSEDFFLLLATGKVNSNGEKTRHTSRLSSEEGTSLIELSPTSPPPKDSYESCGVTRGCFGLPSNCVKSRSCQVLVKYSPEKNGVHFELSSSTISKGEDSWIAVALSGDNRMGNDSVTDCLRFSTGEIKVQQSWNNGGSRSNKVLENTVQGLTEIQHDYTDGVLTCRWERELSTDIEGVTFDLTSEEFFLLVATGKLNSNGAKTWHTSKLASEVALNLTQTLPVNPPDDGTYGECGVKKGCFGLPSNCLDSKSCQVLLTFAAQEDGVIFELSSSAIAEDTDGWIAVGLSMDNKMGDDSVTDCLHYSSGELKIQQSWNKGGEKFNQVLVHLEQGLSEIHHDYTNGKLTCRWKRQLSTYIEGFSFNLTSTNYYLLLATGKLDNKKEKIRHISKIASENSVNLTSFAMVAGKPSHSYLIKIHGAFMVTAWIGIVSVAILLARHYKNVWENHTLCTLQVWFVCHRSLMLTAVSLIIAAFVCIFIHVDGWSQASSPHPILGCVCTGLAVIQPIMAIFRPKPTDSNRYIFNWLHWFVGNSAQIIAVVAMFYAVDLSAANLKSSFFYVVAGFATFHVCFHVIMQIHAYVMDKKAHDNMQMQDFRPKGTPELIEDAPGSGFRRIMLGIYILINIGLVATLVTLIVQA